VELDLSKLAQHYSRANTAGEGSPGTIEGYDYILDQFRRYLIGEKVKAILSSFTLERARDFILHEQSRAKSLMFLAVARGIQRLKCPYHTQNFQSSSKGDRDLAIDLRI
jgi:hypothetical protein